MASDFSQYTATQVAEWISQGNVEQPPSDLYIAVFDDTNTERSGDFQNDRPQTATGTDWNIVSTNSFENNDAIAFGEAETDVDNLVDIALFDDTLANGGNEIARYEMNDTPFNVAEGSTLTFNAGDVSFDVQDRTQ